MTNSGLKGVGGFIELPLPADIQESFHTYGVSDYDFWRKWVFRIFHVLATP